MTSHFTNLELMDLWTDPQKLDALSPQQRAALPQAPASLRVPDARELTRWKGGVDFGGSPGDETEIDEPAVDDPDETDIEGDPPEEVYDPDPQDCSDVIEEPVEEIVEEPTEDYIEDDTSFDDVMDDPGGF